MEQGRTLFPFCIHCCRHFRPSGQARQSFRVARVEGLQYWEYDHRAIGRRPRLQLKESQMRSFMRGGSQSRQLQGQRRLSTPLRGESDWGRRTGANIAPMDLTILRHRVPSRRRVHRTVAANRSSRESNVPLVGQAPAADGEAVFREDSDAVGYSLTSDFQSVHASQTYLS
jgi:hypothetical protein